MALSKLPIFNTPKLRFLTAVGFSLFVLFVALRAVFYFGFSEVGDSVTVDSATLWQTLSVGLRFDFRLAALVCFPLFIVAYLPKFNLVTSAFLRTLAFVYLVIALGVILILYITDFGHYAYLGIRMNSSIVRFMDDVQISSQMVWESYPVIWITLGWALVVALFIWFWKAVCFPFLSEKNYLPRWKSGLMATALFFIAFGISFGKQSLTPLRWSDAFFSGNASVAALGLNPVLYLNDSFHLRETPFKLDKVDEYYPEVADYLGVDASGQAEKSYVRNYTRSDHALVGKGERQPNIVFIMLESLGASRLGSYGNPLSPTPNLDYLSENGYMFKRFYVPVVGTARTVFSSITGLPDVSTVKTATRNPMITDQYTIINELKQHQKFYFIGGSASWANMNSLILTSIDDLNLYQEGDYDSPVVDVWGISDHSLFAEADAVLKQSLKDSGDKPFFAIIQTAANHRPFTIPDEDTGFETKTVSDEELFKWGFKNLPQFNAVRLLDHNIGLFMEMAKKSGYFDNTIFVMYGDHNNRVTQLPHMLPFYKELGTEALHVPGIFYSPKYLKPKVLEESMSLMDVAPTIAGMLGIEYENHAMGRDYFAPYSEDERMVYIQDSDQRNPLISVISKNYMLRMRQDDSQIILHDLNSDTPNVDVGDQFPEKKATMTRLVKGLYETGKYMHYFNSAKWRKANP